jgi:rubrerythrin
VFSIEDIINLAVQIEENAEKFFRHAATRVSNPSLGSLLHWLADEEVKHAKWFSELKHKMNRTVDESQIEDMGKELLRSALADQTFALKDMDLSEPYQIEDLLKRAIEFENDTVLFYEMLGAFVREGTNLDHLNMIIEEEKSHARLLEEFLYSEAMEN